MPASTPYDVTPYESHPFAQTHPGHTGAIAWLHGIDIADTTTARVLEIGCASGGNLIPMAEQLPAAHFTGVDLSARQIGMARHSAEAIGIGNVRFVHADICDFEPDDGPFDYIITHGVYSWMPASARDALMRCCQAHLAPNGIAYISYNTYPGWHLRGAVRDMMLYHTANFESDADKVQQARALLAFLKDNAGYAATPAYQALLEAEVNVLANVNDAYIRHEHLSGDNHPLYFHEFAEHAGKHGLRFLAEADLSNQNLAALGEPAHQALQSLSQDIVRTEQYLDFLRNRTFRQSLLLRADVPLAPRPITARLDPLALSAELQAEQPGPDGKVVFRNAAGAAVDTNDASLIAALALLRDRAPDRLNAGTLMEAICADSPARDGLRENLLKCVISGVVNVHAAAAPYAVAPGKRPRASRVAREQAATSPMVTTLRHELISLDPLTLHVLLALDGSRTLEAIIDEIIDAVVAGAIRMARDDTPLVEPADIRSALGEQLPGVLEALRRNALLMA